MVSLINGNIILSHAYFLHLVTMGFRSYKYASPFLIYAGALVSFFSHGWIIWLPLLYTWAFIPLLELFLKPDNTNLSQAEEDDRKKVPQKLAELDQMVRTYFDTTRDVQKHPQELLIASTMYMWDERSPLVKYSEKKFATDSSATPFKKWACAAPIMADYGGYLIKQYPVEYLKHYLLPNAAKYYAPPIEFLGSYSTGVDSVNLIAKIWFGYPSNKIKCRLKTFNVKIFDFFPILTGAMNIVLLLSIISFFILQGHKINKGLMQGMLLVISLWIVNFGFSIVASPIALRFQLFPILTTLSYTFFLIEYIIILAFSTENKNMNDQFNSETINRKEIMA